MQKKIIYDFGANTGENLPYYLKKADLVVAVEANPSLCVGIREKHCNEIQKGRLVVENCVITTEKKAKVVPFYISKVSSVLRACLEIHG